MKKKLIAISLLMTMAACNATPSNTQTGTQATHTTQKNTASKPVTPKPGEVHNIDNATLQELVAKGVPLIDIRREEEWKQTGVVKGSKTITFFDGMGRVNPNFVPEFTAVTDPQKPVILICRTGNRTSVAGKAIAQQLGYKNVLNVTHGIMGWLQENRPVVKYQK